MKYKIDNSEDSRSNVNNNNIGSSPIKYKVEPGDFKVTIKSQGYQDWSRWIETVCGYTN